MFSSKEQIADCQFTDSRKSNGKFLFLKLQKWIIFEYLTDSRFYQKMFNFSHLMNHIQLVIFDFFTIKNMTVRSTPYIQNMHPFNLWILHIFNENDHDDQQIFRPVFNILLSFLGYGSLLPTASKWQKLNFHKISIFNISSHLHIWISQTHSYFCFFFS